MSFYFFFRAMLYSPLPLFWSRAQVSFQSTISAFLTRLMLAFSQKRAGNLPKFDKAHEIIYFSVW
jgi:hypothetical protein